jgi:2-keto-3-deoxy-L-rhamnonate aldolase RhmA
VDGIDALVVGCADLSLALGVDEPAKLRPAIDRAAAAAQAAGIAMGIAGSGDPATLAGALARPPDLVVYSVDVRLYARAVDGAAQALASALQNAHAPA